MSATPQLFVIGDSISVHYGPFLEKCVQGVFQYDRKRDEDHERAEDNLDYPLGANGGDSSMVLAYLRSKKRTPGTHGGILMLNCGLHDIKQADHKTNQVCIEEYERNLKAIVQEVHDSGWHLVWVRSTPVMDEIHNTRSQIHRHAKDLADYNAVADRIMQTNEVPSIDLHGFMYHFLPDAFIDHVHYSEPVREIQAAYIAGALTVLRKKWFAE